MGWESAKGTLAISSMFSLVCIRENDEETERDLKARKAKYYRLLLGIKGRICRCLLYYFLCF